MIKKFSLWTIQLLLVFALCPVLFANSTSASDKGPGAENADGTPVVVKPAGTASTESPAATEPKLPEFSKFAPGATPLCGLLNLYQKKENLYAEFTSSHLNTDFIIIISIAKGIGEAPLLGGWSWDFGDDMIWQFRKAGDRIQIVRRNFRYQANPGTPEAKALAIGFSDSILYSLPIIAKGPQGGDIVDLTSIFMSDLPMISSKALPGFFFARDRSTWAKLKPLKDNMEIQVAATYSGGGRGHMETVMDTRGVSINIHYSISKLPSSGYQPRLADERVGYFNTVIKNLSRNADDNNFIRYINRWNLQKLESSAEQSLPRKPIVFWLEKSIPFHYRKPIRDGILEWNKAFEAAGFYNAIEVRQQEDNDTWDPEDINYNTVRWSAANAGFAIGPSRINPLTGEILDADILLDVGFIESWNRAFELQTPEDLTQKFLVSPVFTRMFEQQTDTAQRESTTLPTSIDEALFYSQQVGLATMFFDTLAFNASNPEEADLIDLEGMEAGNDSAPHDITTVAAKEKKTDAKKSDAKKSTVKKPDEKKANGKKPDTAKSAAKSDAKSAGKSTAAKKSDVKKSDAKKTEDKETKKAEDKKAEGKKTEDKKSEDKKPDVNEIAKVKKEKYENERKKLIRQGLQMIITHEIGHTLGLRHNFKLSTLNTLEAINSWSEANKYGYVGSIMDYQPANIMPKGAKQGDYYYSYHLGEYDYWAIEYGYKSFGKGTESELDDLKKIASRQSSRPLNYATDEDYLGGNDPLINPFDLGASPLDYAKIRVKLISQILPGLDKRIVKDGESYCKLMSRFVMLLAAHYQSMSLVSGYVGGMHVNRDFKGDPNARPPFQIVSAKEQREAVALLCKEVFGKNSYKIPPQLYNYLAPNRWRHWGSTIPSRYDLEIHDTILTLQKVMFMSLLSNDMVGRLADSGIRSKPGTDVYTTIELLKSINDSIFAELDSLDQGNFTTSRQAISSQRRSLQQAWTHYLINKMLNKGTTLNLGGISLTIDSAGAVEIKDLVMQTLMTDLKRIDAVAKGNAKLDTFTRSHLSDLSMRIRKALAAVAEIKM